MITSRRNPLVRRLRSLAQRSGREQEGLLLLEGSHLLQEVLRSQSPQTDLEVIVTPAWLEAHPKALSAWEGSVRWHHVSDAVLQAALSTMHPDGVACLLPLEALPKPPGHTSFVLALDRVQDPGNLGTLLRTALAADVELVLLASGADPLSPKVVRSSSGALLTLAQERLGPEERQGVRALAERLQDLRRDGLQVVATLVPDASAPVEVLPYWELDWTRPTVLVLGNEGSGLHPELLACCSHGVTLPHSPRVESLNVAAAAVPLLLERRRATMTAPRS